jgi:hypothetical protein
VPVCRLFLLAAASLVAACSVAPMNAVRDLAAIHDETSWQPRSPATMTASPAAYLGEVSTDLARGAGSYEIADHRALELAILDKIGGVPHEDPSAALEATAWLMIAIAHDDHREARIKSAAILSQLAAAWIEREGVSWSAAPPTGDLLAATRAVDAAQDARAFLAAVRLLDAAPLPTGPDAARLLAGVGRTAHALGIGSGHESAASLYRLGARAALAALEAGANDADAAVASACAERAALLRRYAVRG